MLIKRIYLGDFIEEFKRSKHYRKFTIEALAALYNWYNERARHEKQKELPEGALYFNVDEFAWEWEQFENIDAVSLEYGMQIESIEALWHHTHAIELPSEGVLVFKF